MDPVPTQPPPRPLLPAPAPEPPKARTSPALWPFVLGGLAFSTLSVFTNGGTHGAERVGELFGGALLGVFVWSLVARKWFVAAALVAGYLALLGLLLLS